MRGYGWVSKKIPLVLLVDVVIFLTLLDEVVTLVLVITVDGVEGGVFELVVREEDGDGLEDPLELVVVVEESEVLEDPVELVVVDEDSGVLEDIVLLVVLEDID